MASKVDIKKAFDTLDWNFLRLVLQQFGLHLRFINWIMEILHSARISILVNGKAICFFLAPMEFDRVTRSPLCYFVFRVEVLCRGISLALSTGHLSPMNYCEVWVFLLMCCMRMTFSYISRVWSKMLGACFIFFSFILKLQGSWLILLRASFMRVPYLVPTWILFLTCWGFCWYNSLPISWLPHF